MLVFVHIPGTAGRSIRAALQAAGMNVPGSEKFNRFRSHGHLEGAPLYPAFTFVRNPWDRICSMLSRYNLGPETLRREPLDLMFQPQTRWLPYVTYVGRYESLQADFARITGLTSALPWIGRSTDRAPLDDETRNTIAEVYVEEIALFGYCQEGLT